MRYIEDDWSTGAGRPPGVAKSEPGEAPSRVTPSPAEPRLGWDRYFLSIATVVASRGTCDRKRVGAVLVRDHTILATGYNGSIAGLEHCDEVGHLMEDGHCIRTLHAELNAVLQAARNGVRIEGATLYVTASPCWGCFKALANAGVRRLVFREFYREERIFSVARQLGIELVGPL